MMVMMMMMVMVMMVMMVMIVNKLQVGIPAILAIR